METALFFISVFAIMYFFMLRPQIKKQKEQTKFNTELKKGDQVATGSGMIGRVIKFDDQIVELQVDSKTSIKFLKSSISKEATESLGTKNFID